MAAGRFPSERSSNEKGSKKGFNNSKKDEAQRYDFLEGLRKIAYNGSLVLTGYGVVHENNLQSLKAKVVEYLHPQGCAQQVQQLQGQQGPGVTDGGGVVPREVAEEAERVLKGVQTHLQFTLEAGLLYRRSSNGTFPMDVLAKGAPVVRGKDVQLKLEFAKQRRQLYLPYSPVLTDLAQKGWDVPPLGLLLRLGAAESFQTAGNDIVRYRELYASRQLKCKLRQT